ncbi:MAG: DUF4386 family protein [Candidatus Acidiferrales bacterium]
MLHLYDESLEGSREFSRCRCERAGCPFASGDFSSVPGVFRLDAFPDKLFVSGNAAATANNIAGHELLFRLGIAADLIGAVMLIFLVLAFYRLFKGVDQNLA